MTVAEVMKLPSMVGAEVVAGRGGLSHPVESITVLEYGWPTEQLNRFFRANTFDGNELLISDILRGDDDSVSRGIEESEERKIVGDAVRSLPERERAIICLRFGMCGRREHTQKEVAELLGISQSYISRLEKRIIDELHVAIAPKL